MPPEQSSNILHLATTAVKVNRCEFPGCEKTFSRKSNLKAHTRLHTGEKPYMCPDCGKKFKWKSCMASHERVHSRRLDHPLSAAAVAGQQAAREEMREHLVVEQRSRELMGGGVEGTADAFLKQLQLQQMYSGLHQTHQQQQQQQQRETEELVIRQRKRRAEEKQARLAAERELEVNEHKQHVVAEQQRRQDIQLRQQLATQSRFSQDNATQSVQQQAHPLRYRMQAGGSTRLASSIQQSGPSDIHGLGCYPGESQWGVPYPFDHATEEVHGQRQHARYPAPLPAQSLPHSHIIPLLGGDEQMPQEVEHMKQQHLLCRAQRQHAMQLHQNEKVDVMEQQIYSQRLPQSQKYTVPVQQSAQVRAQNGHENYLERHIPKQPARQDINRSAPLLVGAGNTQPSGIEQPRIRQQDYAPAAEELSRLNPKEQSQLAAEAQRLTLMDCFYKSSSAGSTEHVLNSTPDNSVKSVPDVPIGGRQSTHILNVNFTPQEVEELEEEEEEEEEEEDYYEDVDEEDEERGRTEENAPETRINEAGGSGQAHGGKAEESKRGDSSEHQATEDHPPDAQGTEKGSDAPPSVSSNSLDLLSKQVDSLPNLSNASYGSAMDFTLAVGLTVSSGVHKLQSEDADLLPQYYSKTGKRLRSRSSSGRKSSASKLFNDGTGELGQPYFTPDPVAALNRWYSGGLKYDGKWSGNMSDILNTGIEGSGSGSTLLPLLLPDLGVSRSAYPNSISPLGMTLTTPCASPQVATAYTSRGFQSPRNSSHMSFDRTS